MGTKRSKVISTPFHRRFSQRVLQEKQTLILIIIVFAAVLSFYFYLPRLHQVQSASNIQSTPATHLDFVKVASPAAIATAKPTHTPLPIPTNFGRQVKVPVIYYHYIGKNPKSGG